MASLGHNEFNRVWFNLYLSSTGTRHNVSNGTVYTQEANHKLFSILFLTWYLGNNSIIESVERLIMTDISFSLMTSLNMQVDGSHYK